MITETTDTNGKTSIGNIDSGPVLYDARCPVCSHWMHRLAPMLLRRGLRIEPLDSPWAAGTFPGSAREEMHLVLSSGQEFGGADALICICAKVIWLWPIAFLAQIPGVMPTLRFVYRQLAARRQCISGVCKIRSLPNLLPTTTCASKPSHLLHCKIESPLWPILALPLATLLARNHLPDWVFMWLLAGAIFFAAKWTIWRRACRNRDPIPALRSAAFLFAWPGMDASPFLFDSNPRATVRPLKWLAALAQTLFGLLLFVAAAFSLRAIPAILVGWLAMIGIIFFLHFGLFRLLAFFWQSRSLCAEPIMRAPLAASSLRDFWGRRWNTAFNQLAAELALRPLARRFGVATGTVMVFVLSGLLHETVITFPARGGYGLPTAYFTLQGLALIFERTAFARRFGLGHGLRGWAFTFIITAGPVYWLFPPVFIQNIILPMLRAFGAS